MNRKRNRRSNRKETQPKPKTRKPKPLPGLTPGSPTRTHLSCGPIFLLFPGRPILLFSLPLRPTLAPHRAGPVPQRPLSRVALHYAWPTCQRWAHPSAAARVARTRSPPRLAAPPGPPVIPHLPCCSPSQRKPPAIPGEAHALIPRPGAHAKGAPPPYNYRPRTPLLPIPRASAASNPSRRLHAALPCRSPAPPRTGHATASQPQPTTAGAPPRAQDLSPSLLPSTSSL